MATCWGRSGTSLDQSLTVLFRTQSEKTGTETEAGQIKTDLMVWSLVVQSRSKTSLQSVFGPDSWTLGSRVVLSALTSHSCIEDLNFHKYPIEFPLAAFNFLILGTFACALG